MEYQKIINLLDNQTTQPSKFRTRNWFELNDNSRGTYNTNRQIKFKKSMLKSSLSDYIDVYILVKERITIAGAGADAPARQVDERNKGVIVINYALFTECISKINNTQVDYAKDLDVVLPMLNLVEFSVYFSKASGGYGNTKEINSIIYLTDSESFKSKIKKQEILLMMVIQKMLK